MKARTQLVRPPLNALPQPVTGRPWRAVALVVGLVALVTFGLVRAEGTRAAWTDDATAPGGLLQAYTVPAPPTLNCGATGLGSVTLTWAATAVPLKLTGTVGTTSRTIDIPANQTSYTIVAGLLGTGTGTAYLQRADVYPDTTWTSVRSNTRTFTILLGLLASCS